MPTMTSCEVMVVLSYDRVGDVIRAHAHVHDTTIGRHRVALMETGPTLGAHLTTRMRRISLDGASMIRSSGLTIAIVRTQIALAEWKITMDGIADLLGVVLHTTIISWHWERSRSYSHNGA
mmetsp:Transcript_15680/g.25466  ORF Transcript_15680/g.25466 Transcript_15680/m.25466 type:complete len:121 (+) Transcript_15680:967-1329(+)